VTNHRFVSLRWRIPQPVRSLCETDHLQRVTFYLSFFILLVPAIQPLLSSDFTCGYDNTFHLWRAVEVEQVLRQGVLFSRWAPNMAHGYGYPLFNFAAPASTYGVVLLRLLSLSWSWALNLAFAAGWILSACTTYRFVSDILGRHAGIAAAVLYTYAPFHAYDVFYRGGLSQASAWFIPPLILWALRRADRPAGFAVTALGFAGLILTHNAFALLFAPLILSYTLVVRCQRGTKAALRGGAALLVGLGLSAFFWLPALTDLGFVHNEQLRGAWVFEYANNFLPVEQLFAPPRNADPTMINDWPSRGLGLIPASLAVLGLIIALRNYQHRLQVAFFSIALALYLFLSLPISEPVWDAIPLLQRVQFPWRLVGPATLCAAFLTGATLATSQPTNPLASQPARITAALIPLLTIIIGGNLGWFYPRHCSPPQDISAAGMLAWEQATDTLGTTAKGEYLPIWVGRLPDDPAFRAAHATGGAIARLSPESLPEGTEMIHAEYGPTGATVELETSTSFRARYLAFYYPGWRATIDNSPVAIVPTEPDGLISFDVPAGHHVVRVHFGETPRRRAANFLSLISVAALIFAVYQTSNLPSHTAGRGLRPEFHVSGCWLLLTALVLLVTKLALIDRSDTPLRHPNLVGDSLVQVDVPSEITFGHGFALLGYDVLPETVVSGNTVEIKTYWRTLQPGGPDYGVTVNIVDPQGNRWNGPDIHPPRWHRTPPPTWEWQPDQYASIALAIPLLSGTPPGTYTVVAVAFDNDTLAPLTAHDADGHALGPALPLGQITVVAPNHITDINTLNIGHRLDFTLGPLILLGADFDRDRAAPGDPILLTTFWQVKRQPSDALSLTVHLTLLAPDGSLAAEFDIPPTVSWHPTSAWRPGEVWRGQHLLHLPASLDSGDYTWHLTLEPVHQSASLPSRIHVTAPDRTFTSPSVDLETDAHLGNVAVLLGANLEPETQNLKPGTSLNVTLVWRAQRETHTSFHVFLHLLDSAGKLIAQSDGVPSNWTRPTTGWLPGEFITDTHTLTIPPGTPDGDYSLFAGLYVSDGDRLATPDGADAIPLTTIAVQAQ